MTCPPIPPVGDLPPRQGGREASFAVEFSLPPRWGGRWPQAGWGGRPKAAARLAALGIAIAATLLAPPALAYDGPVTRQTFSLPAFRFADGHTLPLTLGYEQYGTLNAARDNAILVTQFFGGSAHAAGRYKPGDRPGYWDALIGDGRALDTRKFCVIAVDTIANVNAWDPGMKATRPGSLDPATGKPYGAAFPAVTIADLVASQHALMTQLGVTRWHAVMGASLGGMQALRWSVDYPEAVGRVVTVAAPGRTDPYTQGICEIMAEAVEADRRRGLTAAWKLLYLQGVSRSGLSDRLRPSALTVSRPAFLAELAAKADARVPGLDPEGWIALSRAARDHDLGNGHGGYEAAIARIQAPVAVIAAEGDLLFPPAFLARDLVGPLTQAGKQVTFEILPTLEGHLGAVTDMEKETPMLRRFLAAPAARPATAIP